MFAFRILVLSSFGSKIEYMLILEEYRNYLCLWRVGPPVPISNTEVKLLIAENTCLATNRKGRSVQVPVKTHVSAMRGFFALCLLKPPPRFRSAPSDIFIHDQETARPSSSPVNQSNALRKGVIMNNKKAPLGAFIKFYCCLKYF